MTEGCPSHWSCSITRYHVGVCSSMQYGYQIICVSWVSSEVLSKANILHAIRIKLLNILYLRKVPLVEHFIWDLAGFVMLDLQFSVWCFVDRNCPFSFFFSFFFCSFFDVRNLIILCFLQTLTLLQCTDRHYFPSFRNHSIDYMTILQTL